MKAAYTIILLLVLLVFGGGCSRDKTTPLAGKWNSVTNNFAYNMVLQNDGTGSMKVGSLNFVMKYKIRKDRVIFEVEGDTLTNNFSLSEDGEELFMGNFFGTGTDVMFNKVK
jgi:hypothetical protein